MRHVAAYDFSLPYCSSCFQSHAVLPSPVTSSSPSVETPPPRPPTSRPSSRPSSTSSSLPKPPKADSKRPHSVSADDARLETLIAELSGKDLNELIAAGSAKLASVPSGGAASSAAPAAGGAAKEDVVEKKEEKVEEKEESDDVRFLRTTTGRAVS